MSEKDTAENKLPSNLELLFTEFLAKNTPATDYANATEKLTTLELLERLQAHYPFGDLNQESLYTMLTQNKFKYRAIGDKYVWLINSVNNKID